VDGELLLTLKEEDLINEMKIDKPLHRKRLIQKITNLGESARMKESEKESELRDP